jgi:hypothetical protein
MRSLTDNRLYKIAQPESVIMLAESSAIDPATCPNAGRGGQLKKLTLARPSAPIPGLMTSERFDLERVEFDVAHRIFGSALLV